MSIAASQQRTFLRLIAQLRPHWRRDAALPVRIHSLLAGHRQFGARDRRLYRELIYTTLRYLPWIEPLLDAGPGEAVRRIAWLAADGPATKSFRAAFAHGEPPTDDKAGLLPVWFRAHCPEIFSGEELQAQLRRAPLWLRLQTDGAGERRVTDEFDTLNWRWRKSPVHRDAIELLTEADVTTTTAWREGRIEIQDLGSQLILASIGIRPGGHWLDACAGAGGKALQLARLLGPGGLVVAHDIRAQALAELKARAARAGVACRSLEETPGGKSGIRELNTAHAPGGSFAPIAIARQVPATEYEGVLVDAPCSGSGTWRRAPHLKWVTTESQITRAAERQRALLHRFGERVRPGGRLVYATCSLSRRENEDVILAFLAAHPDFHGVPLASGFGARAREGGTTFFPSVHDTDGFFVASLQRR